MFFPVKTLFLGSKYLLKLPKVHAQGQNATSDRKKKSTTSPAYTLKLELIFSIENDQKTTWSNSRLAEQLKLIISTKDGT